MHLFIYGSIIKEWVKNPKTRWAFLRGYACRFCVRVPSAGATALGLIREKNAVSFGALIPVTSAQLRAYDERERPGGYRRVKVPVSYFTSEEGARITGDVFTYSAGDPHRPSKRYPIIQSYIDAVLTGLLAKGADYAFAWIVCTKGWGYAKENDRRAPRYPRALKRPDTAKIDRVLRETVRGALQK